MSPESPAKSPPFPIAWRTVSFGTICLWLGAVLFMSGLVGLIVLVILNTQVFNLPRIEGLENRERLLSPAYFAGGFIVLFSGAMLWLAGLCLFLAAPSESGARPIAGGAVATWLLALIMTMQIPLAPMVGIPMRSPVADQGFRQGLDPQPIVFVNVFGFTMAGAMLAIASAVLAMTCICAVAHHFQNARLAAHARWLLAYHIIAMPVGAMAGFVYGHFAETVKGIDWHLTEVSCAVVILGIVGVEFAWLFRVLAEMRRMLRTAEEIAQEQAAAARVG